MQHRSALLLLLLAGCPDRSLGGVYTQPGNVEQIDVPANPDRKADVLFVIDNSQSMKEEQDSLRANFSRFMDVLKTLDGGQPDLHIGVVTSDLGTSSNDGNTAGAAFGCNGKGDDGNLKTTAAVTGRFIADDGRGNVNYSGTLETAFSALADVGIMGCGIEQHLGAMERALENPANVGFMRDDAILTVVVIGDEDDCSMAKQGLFGVSTQPVVVNFECTKDGIECDDTPGDLMTPGQRTRCHSSTHAAYVQGTDRYEQFLRGLKPTGRDLVVAGIVGNPTPFAIQAMGGTSTLAPSCSYGTQNAFPAVRTSELIGRFEYNSRSSICGADLSQSLTEIGAALVSALGSFCFEAEPLDADPTTPQLDPECSVSDVRVDGSGTEHEVGIIPPCATNAAPCWRIVDDAAKCGYTHIDPHYKLEIDRNGVVPAPDIHVKAQCVTVAAPTMPPGQF